MMDWLYKMNLALDYIEKNLSNEIDYNVVAKKACCSSYNFQRMFSFITDVTIAEYIRRRRLTQAALELQNTDIKIIDVAVKYGYNSASSFARAFTKLHGLAPKEAKKLGAKLKAYPKISFKISIKGEKEMDYRIEKKEGFSVFGIDVSSSLKENKSFLTPMQLWEKCHQNGEYEKLLLNSGDLPNFVSKDLCKIHGVENYCSTDNGSFSYMIFSFKSENSKTDGYKIIDIPSQTYAIFPSSKFKWNENFSSILSDLQKRFYTEWLPTASYKRAEGANFEIYGGTNEYGYIELWYPIIKI